MIELTDALKTKIRAKIDFSAAHALKKSTLTEFQRDARTSKRAPAF